MSDLAMADIKVYRACGIYRTLHSRHGGRSRFGAEWWGIVGTVVFVWWGPTRSSVCL